MSGLSVFFLCLLLLGAGYVVYGRLAEKLFGVNYEKVMPCVSRADGVDYAPLPWWKIFLIQLLNIAGLGPVFGALAGCLFGPACLLWIVLGCIFAGALHDFYAALISARHDGENLPETIGRYLGKPALYALRCVCVLLLVLVGVVFTKGPAGMLHSLCPGISVTWWCVIILGYYFAATILPINTIIGRVYPLFGALFVVMALGLLIGLPLSDLPVLPNLDVMTNVHPKGIGIWPMIFVTIACGAISGFHATQSPLMVRCTRRPQEMRRIFYGAMICEGAVALIWACVGLSLRDTLTAYAMGPDGPVFGAEGGTLSFMQLTLASPATAVTSACDTLMGGFGTVLAVLGVTILPITSGDTAMRSCRLMLADTLRLRQNTPLPRLAIALPLFAAVIIISQIDFSLLWRYFGWSNQALSCITLWMITVFLRRNGRCFWPALIPALFMTVVCTAYLLVSKDCGIELPSAVGTWAGIILAAGAAALLLLRRQKICG